MLENILKNIAYSYYPKNICNIIEREKYNNSLEFIKLQSVLNSFYKDNKNIHFLKLLKREFDNNIEINKIQDKTSLNIDRCLTYELEIIENDKTLIRVCLNISLIVPYYIIYVLENEISLNPYKWLTLPIRNKEKEKTKYYNLINSIRLIVEKNLKINSFPKNLLHTIIPDLSFQDNTFNNFTFANAFFLDENIL